jgi:hypothetical protein
MANDPYGQYGAVHPMYAGQVYGGPQPAGGSMQSQEVIEAFNRNLQQFNYNHSVSEYYSMSSHYYQGGYGHPQAYYVDAYGQTLAYPQYAYPGMQADGQPAPAYDPRVPQAGGQPYCQRPDDPSRRPQ